GKTHEFIPSSQLSSWSLSPPDESGVVREPLSCHMTPLPLGKVAILCGDQLSILALNTSTTASALKKIKVEPPPLSKRAIPIRLWTKIGDRCFCASVTIVACLTVGLAIGLVTTGILKVWPFNSTNSSLPVVTAWV